MDLKPTKPLSGFIELLPAQQRCFDFCAARMLDVLKTSGFNMLDLPAIERAEVLTDKDNWDEIETQMFLFQKGDTKMGLRYDGTVGLSRYVAGHLNDLTFPFRASQFSKRYRGERAQRGRYREFYQMDMDIMGVNSLSTNYDAEIISVIQRTLNSVSEFILSSSGTFISLTKKETNFIPYCSNVGEIFSRKYVDISSRYALISNTLIFL